jgi:ATP-dependent Clp protease ATP-binding subunit ClpB
VFHRLTNKHILAIVEIRLQELIQRLAANNIHLEFDASLKRHIASVGYDPLFGARPLKRVIQRDVEDFLAKKMLAGELQSSQKYRLEYTPEAGVAISPVT